MLNALFYIIAKYFITLADKGFHESYQLIFATW
jgi:hypothetical protein